MPLPIFKQNTNKVCYMILPEGIKSDLYDGLKGLSEKHGVSIVVIDSCGRIQESETLWRKGGSIPQQTDP